MAALGSHTKGGHRGRPYLPTEGAQQNKKASQSLVAESEGWSVPSFRRRVRPSYCSWAGFLALGLSPSPPPSLSAARKSGCPSGDGLRGSGSPVTVAGPRPIFTAFPFPPVCAGAPQEQKFSKNDYKHKN